MPDLNQTIDWKILKNRAKANWDLVITDEQLRQFVDYTAILLDWNQRINLTAIIEPKDIIIKHFIDSMAFIKKIDYYYPQKNIFLADIGTGAGFPGIPITILRPQIHVTLIDSLAKRISFLDYLITQLNLRDIQTCHARAEDLGRNKKHRELYDVVVARAVAELPVLLEYCVPLLKVGGRLIAAKGIKPEDEISSAKNALNLLNSQIETLDKYKLANGADYRSLIVIRKNKSTPEKYPRQPGKPKKNPL